MAYAGVDAEAVRAVATEVLLLDHEGHTNEALVRARDLVLAHPDLAIPHRLLGELAYAAGIRAALGERTGTLEAMKAASEPHLRVARDAFVAARRLAPNCVEIAAALGDAFQASRMFQEAEGEYQRAARIPYPSDPALHNASYGMFEGYEHERDPDFAGERVGEAMARARAAYSRMTVEDLVPMAIFHVLAAGRQLGAAHGRKQAKRVAETFPSLARTQYLEAYMDLEFVRSLDAAIDKRPFLRRTLAVTERVARDYPKSPVIASFHAKLLFVLGEYDAAEMECRRALDMKEPDDPQQDCIPPESITGDNRGARLVSLACEFHDLLNKILMRASDYWDSMSSERQRYSFLHVRFDVLQDEYCKVDRSYAFTMSDVRSFVKEHKSWRFWICPLCDRKKFVDSGLLLSHMCSRHPRAVLPRLQLVLDQKATDEALKDDDSLDGVTICEYSEQQDMICFQKSSEVFKWLFYAPSSGLRPKPFPEVREMKVEKGRMLLENMKEKMKTLPADRSSAEFAKAIPEIQEGWHKFLKSSALDYRGVILELARSLLWRELKKCMTEDPELGAKWISAVDIDAIFTKEVVHPASNAVEEHDSKSSHAEEDQETGENKQSAQTDGALMVSGDCQESNVQDEGDSSENPTRNTESSDPTISVAESVTDLATKLDKLEIDPKISDKNLESDVQVEGENYEATVTGTELSGQPINIAESGNDPDTKMDNLQTDPSSDSAITASDAGSSGQDGGQED